MTPTRAQIINAYWVNDLSMHEVADKFDVPLYQLKQLFKQYGILVRHVGGRAGKTNRMRLELMLLPSLQEWRGMRPYRMQREE